MSLTHDLITSAQDDDALYALLAAELSRLLPPTDDLDALATSMAALPVGLRSMAASYNLDVSMTLDDFGWHFANWHHRGLAELTLEGLRELGATWEAALFETALFHALQHWSFFERDDFSSLYYDSPLYQLLEPLDRQFLEMAKAQSGSASTILEYWAPYARQHPERVVPGNRTSSVA